MIVGAVADDARLALASSWRLWPHRRLIDALEAVSGSAAGSRCGCAGADAHGDEIARLAAHVERMSERIASSVAALERAASRRRELLANVSHDLRTPLASMQGYLELLLLRHGNLGPRRRATTWRPRRATASGSAAWSPTCSS